MFSDPHRNIEELGLSDGGIVADLGSGSGFYTLFAAKAVAPSGKVYAVDVHKDLLDKTKREATKLHLHNVDVILGNLEKLGGSKIKDSSCDVAIASNILFMLEDQKAFMMEARRILKPNGRLLVIDWSASFSQMGPHSDHVFYKDDAMKLAASSGFEFDREISAGTHHYGIIFRKQ